MLFTNVIEQTVHLIIITINPENMVYNAVKERIVKWNAHQFGSTRLDSSHSLVTKKLNDLRESYSPSFEIVEIL